jgi:hypothetical protein
MHLCIILFIDIILYTRSKGSERESEIALIYNIKKKILFVINTNFLLLIFFLYLAKYKRTECPTMLYACNELIYKYYISCFV